MNLILSTWMHADADNDAALYPSVGRDSGRREFQAVYWRCIGVFFSLARATHPFTDLRLYTNVHTLPRVDEVDLNILLRELRVEVVTLPFTFNPTPQHSDRWRNQFYIFDVLTYISQDSVDNVHVVLDSDCVIRCDLTDIIRTCCAHGALTLQCEYPSDRDTVAINGLTLTELDALFVSTAPVCQDGNNVSRPAIYAGGEFFCATSPFIRRLVSRLPAVWQLQMQRVRSGDLRFMEEAHMLSFFYWLDDVQFGTANTFIRRMWTSFKYNNVTGDDLALPVWHLPAEKHYGFRRAWDSLARYPRTPLQWASEELGRVDSRFGIPRRSLEKALRDLTYKTKLKLAGTL